MELSTDLIPKLFAAGLASPETIVPCSEGEITYLEEQYKISLPSEYRDFLRLSGKCSGILLADCDFLFPELLTLRSRMEAKLQTWESGSLRLPAAVFVFLSRLDEQFFFFFCDNSRNSVFSYYEGDGAFSELPLSFGDFLEKEIQLAAAVLAGDPHSPYWSRFETNARKRASWVKSLGFPPSACCEGWKRGRKYFP